MDDRLSIFQGCLLGLAVGDAMGYTVDGKTYGQIRQDYGPNGLLGYDLVNGCAEVSSYTQIAAFACNGLLLSLTRPGGKVMPCTALALREWAQTQRYTRDPERRACWVCRIPALRERRSMDPRLADTLCRPSLGTLESPVNRLSTPGSLTAVIPLGLFFSPQRMQIPQVGLWGAQTVALTHGDPDAFLSGAALAYLITGIVQDRATALPEHIRHAADAVAVQFGKRYPQANDLRQRIYHTLSLTESMETLVCGTASQVLCGAVYASVAAHGDFDAAMIAAVNHSGRSAAVGALTGAILGAMLGKQALPEFYLECLGPVAALETLAADLSCPPAFRLFDDDWDRKYGSSE